MKLLLLRCPVCQEPLKPADRDVYLSCTNCHEIIQLDDRTGISQAAVNWAMPTDTSRVTDWLPVWVTHGRVNITTRATQGTNNKALKESQAMWAHPRALYAPAWELPIPQSRKLGSHLIESQPNWVKGSRPADVVMTAANITPNDAHQLIQLIILTIEAERKDWMKSLAFNVEAPAPELWVVPAENTKRGLNFIARTRS